MRHVGTWEADEMARNGSIDGSTYRLEPKLNGKKLWKHVGACLAGMRHVGAWEADEMARNGSIDGSRSAWNQPKLNRKKRSEEQIDRSIRERLEPTKTEPEETEACRGVKEGKERKGKERKGEEGEARTNWRRS
jgi:hypothetical protein